MRYHIRTKLMIAFMVFIFIQLIVTTGISYYNHKVLRTAFEKIDSSAGGVSISGDVQQLLNEVLMPANDYLITGDMKYKDDFQRLGNKLENQIFATERLLEHHERVGIGGVKIEKEYLENIKGSWLKVKELSNRIFAVENPVGNKNAAKLMEEMDYRWGRPASANAHRLYETETMVYKKAIEIAYYGLTKAWTLMIAGNLILIGAGVLFAVLYSRHFTIPIKRIQENAAAMAGGNFQDMLVIKTGDEVQELAGAINEMAGQLNAMYSNLEGIVTERTRELEDSREALKMESDKLKGIFEAMEDGIYIVNQKNEIEYVNPVIEREFGPVKGRKCFEYLHDRGEVCPWCPNERVFAGETVRWEWYSVKNGKTYDLMDTPLRNADGSISKLEIFRDITVRKKEEETLKKYIDELEQFRKVTINRELRMRELKDKIEELEKHPKRRGEIT